MIERKGDRHRKRERSNININKEAEYERVGNNL
jgi:hypothetical protein